MFILLWTASLSAAPTAPAVDVQEKETDTDQDPAQLNSGIKKAPEIETLSSGTIPESPKENSDLEEYQKYFYRYNESLSFRLGANHDFGNPPDEEDDNTSAQLGFAYMFESEGKAHIETGFDLFPKREEFLIHVGLKVVEMYTEAFRPHYKLGAALKLDSGDKFNTPIKTENYFIFGGLGFEDTLSDPISVRVDMELFYSKDNALFVLSAGLTWGFN